MKKIIALFLLGMFWCSFAVAQEHTLRVDPKSPGFKITKHWQLNSEHDFIYVIENPTKAILRLVIEVAPNTVNNIGELTPSSPIKLTCGGTEFYVSSLPGFTVCKTSKAYPDIKFELIRLDDGGASEGELTLEFK